MNIPTDTTCRACHNAFASADGARPDGHDDICPTCYADWGNHIDDRDTEQRLADATASLRQAWGLEEPPADEDDEDFPGFADPAVQAWWENDCAKPAHLRRDINDGIPPFSPSTAVNALYEAVERAMDANISAAKRRDFAESKRQGDLAIELRKKARAIEQAERDGIAPYRPDGTLNLDYPWPGDSNPPIGPGIPADEMALLRGIGRMGHPYAGTIEPSPGII